MMARFLSSFRTSFATDAGGVGVYNFTSALVVCQSTPTTFRPLEQHPLVYVSTSFSRMGLEYIIVDRWVP